MIVKFYLTCKIKTSSNPASFISEPQNLFILKPLSKANLFLNSSLIFTLRQDILMLED